MFSLRNHWPRSRKPMTQEIDPKAQAEVPRTSGGTNYGHLLIRALIGAAVGGLIGFFVIKREIPGAVIGAALGWYLIRGLLVGLIAAALGAVLH